MSPRKKTTASILHRVKCPLCGEPPSIVIRGNGGRYSYRCKNRHPFHKCSVHKNKILIGGVDLHMDEAICSCGRQPGEPKTKELVLEDEITIMCRKYATLKKDFERAQKFATAWKNLAKEYFGFIASLNINLR